MRNHLARVIRNFTLVKLAVSRDKRDVTQLIYLFIPQLPEWLNIDICIDNFKESRKTAVGEKLHEDLVAGK